MSPLSLVALIPMVTQLIDLAEQNASEGTTGAQKADAVVASVGVIWDVLAAEFKIKEGWVLVEPALRLLISLLVKLFNALGKFKTGGSK